MRPAFGGAGTPAMRLLPRRLRLPRRVLLASVESVVALMPWQLGSLPRARMSEKSSMLEAASSVASDSKILGSLAKQRRRAASDPATPADGQTTRALDSDRSLPFPTLISIASAAQASLSRDLSI